MINLLCLSLFLVPLIGPVTWMPIIDVKDLWIMKELAVLLSVVGICLMPSSCRPHTVNPWLKAMMVFLVLAAFLIPPIHLLLGPGIDLGGLWTWRAMAWAFVYFMLYRKIVSGPILHINQKELIAKAIGYAALISAVYASIQFINLDQFQVVLTPKNSGIRTAGEIAAMIGNATYLAVFLGISLPFCLYAMRKWQTGVVIVAILLCQSDTATLGAAASLVLMALIRAKRLDFLKLASMAVIFGIVALCASWGQIRPFVKDRFNGRLLVWHDTLKDWKAPAISLAVTPEMTEAQKKEVELLNHRTCTLTGRGLGSYEYLFQRTHPGWNSAHNCYLQALYEIGLIGLVLLLGMIGFVFWNTFELAMNDEWIRILYCSFFFICFSAMTLPVLIIEPLRLFSVVVFILLSANIARKKIILK